MCTNLRSMLVWGAIMLLVGWAPRAGAVAVGTAFVYQGRLQNGGAPANGSFDLRFRLFDLPTTGTQVGGTVTLDNVNVQGGLFTAELNFGTSAFGGGSRWLEVNVRPGASTGAFTLLSPRQLLRPAPYALAMPNVFVDEANNFVGIGRNFRITGNEVFGIRSTSNANQYGGMYVETSNAAGWPFYGYATNGNFRAWTYYDGATSQWFLHNAGVRLRVPSTGGLQIGSSTTCSLLLTNTPASDGMRVLDTGDDAIQIGSPPDVANYGVYIPSPGVSTYGIWSNTADAAGEWAFYSVDKIRTGTVSADAFSTVAKVAGDAPLTAGDVVAAAGLAKSIPGSAQPLVTVKLADAEQSTGLVGVVQGRMVWAIAPGKEEEGEMALQRAEGPAQPGDYVALTVLGVAQVKVAAGEAIAVGDRLTASSKAGRTRGLKTTKVNGVTVGESAPTIGTALEPSGPGRETIPVYVSLR